MPICMSLFLTENKMNLIWTNLQAYINKEKDSFACHFLGQGPTLAIGAIRVVMSSNDYAVVNYEMRHALKPYWLNKSKSVSYDKVMSWHQNRQLFDFIHNK